MLIIKENTLLILLVLKSSGLRHLQSHCLIFKILELHYADLKKDFGSEFALL